jgi:hypothetical protein
MTREYSEEDTEYAVEAASDDDWDDVDTKTGLERAAEIKEGVEGLADAEAMLEVEGATDGVPVPITDVDFSIDAESVLDGMEFEGTMKLDEATASLERRMTEHLKEEGVLDTVEEVDMTMRVGPVEDDEDDTDTDDVQFGPCTCSKEEEEWIPVKTPNNNDIMTEELEYECLTCGVHYRPFKEGDADARK